jgi:DNA-binding IclR family transcriptional regulator
MVPMGLGAPGRLLSAFSGQTGEPYDTIRTTGVYAATGERDPKISGIAAPVFGRSGELIGALAIVGPRSRFDSDFVARMTKVVRDVAGIATAALRD